MKHMKGIKAKSAEERLARRALSKQRYRSKNRAKLSLYGKAWLTAHPQNRAAAQARWRASLAGRHG